MWSKSEFGGLAFGLFIPSLGHFWLIYRGVLFCMKYQHVLLWSLLFGSGVGAFAGFLRGLTVVHPENHGFLPVFSSGLTGRYLRSVSHGAQPIEERVDFFELPM